MNTDSPLAATPAEDRPRVLLVDDDEVNLMLTSAALRERGFEVAEVSSGAEALGRLDDVAPDMVVLDALMPDMDGFATCQALRARPGYGLLPVLMLTGPGRRRLDRHAPTDAGATDFFVKSHAVEPAGRAPALPAARVAHPHRTRTQQVQAGARAGPGAHGQLRLEARQRH
jgi:CheY-like chemotaxis protein